MFLKAIELFNFKCHEHIFLDFDESVHDSLIRKTTFLLGENGTGKSTLLKAIALITAGSGAFGDMLGNPDQWVKVGCDSCELIATFTGLRGRESSVKITIRRGNSHRATLGENSEALDQIDQALEGAGQNFVIAYGASRRLNTNPYFTPSGRGLTCVRSGGVQSLFDPEAALVSVTDWAMTLDYKGNRGEDIVRSALDSFLFETVTFSHIDRENSQLIFNTPDGEIALDQLSEGFQNVASWVGDLMYRVTEISKESIDPLSAPGLLLIDEIDLHLHPRWQRKLHSFLQDRLPNFQIVASTHSPLTAQQADEYELYTLRRESDNSTEIIPFVGAPNMMLLHQVLLSPSFGLETDESIRVQQAKAEVRDIELKDIKTKEDEKILEKHTDLLESIPINDQANSLFSPEDFELLRNINNELKKLK